MKHWIKVKLILLSVAVVWLFFIIAMAPLILPVTVAAIWIKDLRTYRYKLWISQDQLVNAIHNGHPDHTISGRIGYESHKGSKTAAGLETVVDLLFKIATGEENHCYNAIEWDRVEPL